MTISELRTLLDKLSTHCPEDSEVVIFERNFGATYELVTVVYDPTSGEVEVVIE